MYMENCLRRYQKQKSEKTQFLLNYELRTAKTEGPGIIIIICCCWLSAPCRGDLFPICHIDTMSRCSASLQSQAICHVQMLVSENVRFGMF